MSSSPKEALPSPELLKKLLLKYPLLAFKEYRPDKESSTALLFLVGIPSRNEYCFRFEGDSNVTYVQQMIDWVERHPVKRESEKIAPSKVIGQ